MDVMRTDGIPTNLQNDSADARGEEDQRNQRETPSLARKGAERKGNEKRDGAPPGATEGHPRRGRQGPEADRREDRLPCAKDSDGGSEEAEGEGIETSVEPPPVNGVGVPERRRAVPIGIRERERVPVLEEIDGAGGLVVNRRRGRQNEYQHSPFEREAPLRIDSETDQRREKGSIVTLSQ
jgi:hypothetical protein